ncbi:MAG: glycosyltransferase family 2 protein [Candidatus Eisenbacteria bacterium]|nr:glycosyltransferase family 2 protein [Candidatus Eisenbacteria bacterium]
MGKASRQDGPDPVSSIVVPVFGSTVSLPILAERLRRVFENDVGEPYEIIFVDDDSPDPETWPILLRLAESDPAVRAVRLTRNFGQSAAVLCGIGLARGEYLIGMDDDLQHAPEEIPKLIAERHHDVVFARFRKRRHPFSKRWTGRIKSCFDWMILGKPLHLQSSSFFLMRRAVARGVLAVRTPFPLLTPLVYHATRDVVNVEVEHRARAHGKSRYTLARRLRLFSNLIINNSAFLLTVIGVLGTSLSAASLLLFLFYLCRRLFFGIGLSGWTSLMLAVLGIGGVLLFGVGVIGTYLVRIIQTSESRPSYVVRYDSARDGLLAASRSGQAAARIPAIQAAQQWMDLPRTEASAWGVGSGDLFGSENREDGPHGQGGAEGPDVPGGREMRDDAQHHRDRQEAP